MRQKRGWGGVPLSLGGSLGPVRHVRGRVAATGGVRLGGRCLPLAGFGRSSSRSRQGGKVDRISDFPEIRIRESNLHDFKEQAV